MIDEKTLEIIKISVDEAVSEAAKAIQLRLSDEQEQYILKALTEVALGRLIQIGTQIGTQTAIDTMKNERQERIAQRFFRRLRNTKVLLREYRKLKAFCENAIYKKDKESAIQILEEIDSYEHEEELFVEAIKKSKERTLLIIRHIDKMLDVYKIICEKSSKDEHKRKYHIVNSYYLVPEEEKKTIEKLANELFITRKTAYNDIDDAARYLTNLVFGVDGLKL